MFTKKLDSYDVAVVCWCDDAAVVFVCNVIGKGNIFGKIVLVKNDDFFVGVPFSQRLQARFANIWGVFSTLKPQPPNYVCAFCYPPSPLESNIC